jgi:predicted nucleic acid-binding Zn ribbon protein
MLFLSKHLSLHNYTVKPNDMKNEQSVSEVLQMWLKDERFRRKVQEAKLINGWSSICGDMIAADTSSIRLQDRTLTIKVQSAPLRQELLMGKDLLLNHIEEYLGERIIDDVKIY